MFRLFGRAPRPPVVPEPPQPFGHNIGWFAVPSGDPAKVARALGLRGVAPVGWQAGMTRAMARRSTEVLICPPMNGWVMVITGLQLVPDNEAGRMALLAHLGALERTFGAAQHFLSYRVADFVSHIRMEQGKITRAFGWSGSEGAVLVNHGPTGPEEIAAGMPDLTGMTLAGATAVILARMEAELSGLDEGLPARIAGAWSVDPILAVGPPSTCLIGTLPG
jgi:hypothetical protein